MAKPYSVTYAKVRALVRTCQETSKIHQILAVLGKVKYQNSDFLGFRGPRGILCTRGEKEHTSKRVSVIACDNVISKEKCATRTRLRTNPSRTPKIHQNLYFLERIIFKHPNGCFFIRAILIPCNASYVIARHKSGDPAGYCVPVGRRSTQAKE